MPIKDPEKRRERSRFYYHKNKTPEKLKAIYERSKPARYKYRKENRDKINAQIRKNYNPIRAKKNYDKIKEKLNEKCRQQAEVLDNLYLIRQLRKDGFSLTEIKENPELMEIKKIILKTKRLCKQLETSNN